MKKKSVKSEVVEMQNLGIGENEFETLRKQLDEFVKDNFDTLYEGAVRLKLHIEEDYYAPKRIQINNTRLHRHTDLKIAGGHHKYHSDEAPTEKQLRQTVSDLQTLLDSAAKVIKAPFTITIS